MRGVRKTLKRIAALGTGLTMVGATIVGAAAADLADYPAPFVVDGQFDGYIVVGDNANAADVIGSVDIATALQADSVTEVSLSGAASGLYTPLAIPGVSVSGDVAEIGQPNDLLEIDEFIGDVKETLTERDLNALKGGVITTDEGTTDYNQYLRFQEPSGIDAFNSSLKVVYAEDEDDNVGDFLFASDSSGSFMFEYEMEFEEGAESEIVSTTELDDLEDEIINLLGTPFAISDTDIDTAAQSLTIEMLGGAISDIMEEGETKTYVIGDKEYETTVLIISDAREVVKFNINGEITDELRDGETDILKDGTRIGIREILPNEAEEVTGGDIVEFYLGATEVEFEDSNFTDGLFESGVEVNDESIEDGTVSIRGALFSNNRKFEILSIKYRLEADTLIGDLYVPPGHGIREYLDEPEGLLSPNWDIVYGGLMDTGVSILKLDASGDDEYDLRFTTQEGLNYNIELLDNDATSGWRWGDDDDDLIWVEAGNATGQFIINEDDEFILTGGGVDETGLTHVVAYESADKSDSQLTFTDLYGETREFTWESTTQDGVVVNKTDLIFGGNTFVTFVGGAPAFNLSVDNNNDGVIGDGAVGSNNTLCAANRPLSSFVGLSINSTGGILPPTLAVTSTSAVGPCRAPIVIQGGGVLDLGPFDGQHNTPTASDPVAVGTKEAPVTLVGTGANAYVTIALKTLGSEFDENGPQDLGGSEVIVVTLDNRSNFEVGLNVEETGSHPDLKLEEIKENDDIERDMSSYGVLVEVYDPEGSDEAEDLTFEYPLIQRGAHVFVVAGEYGIEKQAAGAYVTQQIQRIAVGAAKLASEVEDITAVNAIVVGGPCANAAAAALMGNPADCVAGFEAGKAMIKLYENAGNVAVLVAGFDALDTRRAARVLANHADYALSGSEAEVTGTSLTDISVRSV